MKYDKNHALLECSIPGLPQKSGKVRDVFDLGDSLLMVVTDRISAFDVILPCGVPDKGKVLNQLSLFWLDFPSPWSSAGAGCAKTCPWLRWCR